MSTTAPTTPASASPFARLLDLALRPSRPDLNADEPFVGESDYWALSTYRFELTLVVQEFEDQLFRASWNCAQPSAAEAGQGGAALAERLETTHDALAHARAKLEEITDCLRRRELLTNFAPPAPRVLRLARRLHLDEQDRDVLTYVVMSATDFRYENPRLSSDLSITTVAKLLRLPPAKAAALWDASHFLRTEEIAVADDGILGWRRTDLTPQRHMALLLRGLPTSDRMLLGLGNGAVRETLLEEEAMRLLLESASTNANNDLRIAGPDARRDELPADDEDLSATTEDEETLDEFLRRMRAVEADSASVQRESIDESRAANTDGEIGQGPWQSDLEYLKDHLLYFRRLYSIRSLSREDEPLIRSRDRKEGVARAMALREEKLKANAALQALRLRQAATADTAWTPRGERMTENYRLCEFEKFIVLLAAGIASVPSFVSAIGGRSFGNDLDVSTVLDLFFADSDEEQIRRRVHFYKDAPLVRSLLIDLHAGLGADLGRASIAIDRSVLDFLLGIDVEGQDMVEGSHLYYPDVLLEHVILNEADKQLVVQAVENFPAFVKERRRSGLDGRVSYGLGLAILLYGPSGTGKTMLANAIATSLRQPVLLANFSRLNAGDIRAVFRIARLNRALLFFDECEGIFLSRGLGGDVQALLSEMERYDGICILATNRPQDLDEAMSRRIQLKVAFHVPDAAQRKRIFEAHLPPSLSVGNDIDLRRLAWNYELSGGLIKNAVLVAVSIAASRNPSAPVVQHSDLEEGCRRQLVGRMQMSEFEGRVIPTVGMSAFVADPETRGALQDVIGFEKSRRTLEQWGLGNGNVQGSGTVVMFHGPPGTGKSRGAEVVAFELGRPIKRVQASSLISKWVGETSKAIVDLFSSARAHDAVLVMDEADALLSGRTAVSSSTDRYANLDVDTLLQELENYPGVAILTTNLLENIDSAFLRRMLRVVEFRRPDRAARAALWRLHLPAEMPLAEDVNVDALAAAEELSGGQIRNAVRNAAAHAALRLSDAERRVTMSDLLAAAAGQLTEPGQRTIGFRVA